MYFVMQYEHIVLNLTKTTLYHNTSQLGKFSSQSDVEQNKIIVVKKFWFKKYILYTFSLVLYVSISLWPKVAKGEVIFRLGSLTSQNSSNPSPATMAPRLFAKTLGPFYRHIARRELRRP